MAASTVRQDYNALLIEHRQQVARLYAVEQLARDFLSVTRPACVILDNGHCMAHWDDVPCPFATLLERAWALGLAD